MTWPIDTSTNLIDVIGSVALIPDLRNATGGPASFQKRLAGGLSRRQIDVHYNLDPEEVDTLLLINATKRVESLWRAKKRGVRIVQRLGLPFPSNTHLSIGPLGRIRTWLGMKNMAFTRSRMADRIVYQSRFVQECWRGVYGRVNKASKLIYNGVDLESFNPEGPRYESQAEICIISVEGTQSGPVNSPALLLAQALIQRGFSVELIVFGAPWGNAESAWSSYSFVSFKGLVPNEELPSYYRGATLYVSTDIVAGCPNAVIEALACGTPVAGYGLGVLPEMLTLEAGRCVPARGNPWKGDHPGNAKSLFDGALEIIENNSSFRKGARNLAEERYGLDHMVDQYLKIFFQ